MVIGAAVIIKIFLFQCGDFGSVHYKEPLKSLDKSVHSRSSFCRDFSMIVQKAT